jgi:hypothetical protein
VGIITHPITYAELKGLKQKGSKSLKDYYRHFSELRAPVHEITEREEIEAFSQGIMAKWQFQDFCKENPRNNKEFRRTVEKMITAEEKTRERFPDRNNQDNNRDNSDRQNYRNNRHQDRKRGPDNTVAIPEKSKKFLKFKRFEDIENMHCIWHSQGNHTTGDCRIFSDRYTRKGNKGDKKKDDQKKEKIVLKTKDFSNQKGQSWSSFQEF